MTKSIVNKPDAARRQVDLAIRLLFAGEDPIGIHTLVSAGFRIVRDLLSARDENHMLRTIEDHIVPGMEARFWRHFNGPANFLKHADKDGQDLLNNIDWEVNPILLIMATKGYQDLGYAATPEMKALSIWVRFMYPKFLKVDFPWPSDLEFMVDQLRARAKVEPHVGPKIGYLLLRSVRGERLLERDFAELM